jgi:hypothetical protein
MASLAKFNELNDAFEDPLVQAAGKAAMASEQYADLVNAGFLNVEKFKETTCRAPTDHDIFQLHLQARPSGVRGLRSTNKLLDDVAATIEGKFGIKRRVTDIDNNRKRAIREMQKQRGVLQWGDGLAPDDDQPTPRAQPRDGDQPAVGFVGRWLVARSPRCSVRPTPFFGMGPTTQGV